MKCDVMSRWVAAVAFSSATLTQVVFAQEAPKTLPTLLIKGEVVAMDTSDPAAALLKVKDRYGFETPIFLSSETKITKGGQPLTAANLTAGTAVEVEYHFDINTAKRHAVAVTVSAPAAAATAAPATPAAAAPAPSAAPAAAPAATTPSSSGAASAQPVAAPAAPKSSTGATTQ